MKGLKFLVVLVASFALLGCAPSSSDGDVLGDEKVEVVATVGMLADMVKNVGGERVEVKALMGANVDPHAYQPTAGDMRAMQRADVVFYVGLHLEGKMVDVFESMAKDGRAFGTGEFLDESRLLSFDGQNDPHIWFDLVLWADTIEGVRDKLSEVDPEGAEEYAINAERYFQEIMALDEWVRGEIEQIPVERRVLVTAHDAFGYFGRAYGVEVEAIQGINTVQEYGVKDLEELVDFIVEKEVPLIFVESSVSQRSMNALREGVMGRGFEVEIGGELFSDAMGPVGSEAGTYVGMVRHNVFEISKLKN
ncbi:manganese transporter [Candidatus Peregrinibacteria bacterium HGW-Peregrinibacteria-1]|jgi:manganese/zinc/iron transport system substrate-binding protein|nr:MAG: manganese transporter [Candidatus Peregrinibacteria bacterium HGW-Peregrinibacteria-1]